MSFRHPSRVILNFGHRCGLRCSWCYVPFGGSEPDRDMCRRIVERSTALGFRIITFGGGDPLQYDFLPELVLLSKKLGLFVHVDTNGIGFRGREEAITMISSLDLLGLPLDGPRADVHDQMRGTSFHFNLVLDLVDWLSGWESRLKINTIVSEFNANEIREMPDVIARISPARWSLYQYWPLSGGIAAKAEHAISNRDFSRLMSGLPRMIGRTVVEHNSRFLRRLTYPFVSHDGNVYVHHNADSESYEFLGSYFDDAVVARVFSRCGAERENALSRYV